MEYEPLLACTLAGALAGWLGGSLMLFRCLRRCTKLEYRVLDLEERTTTIYNRRASEKRWTKEQQLEQELASLAPKAAHKRFDNDPLEY